MSFKDWVSDGLDQIKGAAMETLAGVGEGVIAGAVGALNGAQPEGHNQPASGPSGAGGAVHVPQSPYTGTETPAQMGGQMPGWLLPVGIGLATALTIGVAVSLARR